MKNSNEQNLETVLNERTLEEDVPELKEFLKPGMKVLDIGCNCGSITEDVANVVRPGEVVGLDPDEQALSQAREIHQPDNIEYVLGDSHRLNFPDNTFDLVYSHTVVHFFLDPVAALKEQKRVTKPGGWVIISGVRDLFAAIRHPACPNWDRMWNARNRRKEIKIKDFQNSDLNPEEYLEQQKKHNPTCMNVGHRDAGRKCTGWMVDAGLKDFRVKVKAERVQYLGSKYFEPNLWDHLPRDDDNTPFERQVKLQNAELVNAGLIDGETLDKARQELDAWYKDPHAFNFNILIFVAGKVD